MEKFFKKPLGLLITAGLCCFLWGSAFPAIKTGYSLFGIASGDTASILLFAGVRFFLAGVLTVVIFSLIGKRLLLPKGDSFKRIGVLSVFQTVLQYVFFYLGLAFTSGSRASVINASSVFFALFISAFVFRFERFKAYKLIGSAVGFIGVILISLDAFKGSGGIKGELFILISSVSYAFSSAFMKKYSEYDNPAMLSGYQFMLGGAVLTATGLAFGGRLSGFSVKGVLLLVYMALISAVAYSLWSILLKYNDVSRVAVCGFMTPVFGYFLSALFDKSGYAVSFQGVIALLLVVFGIVIVNYDNSLHKKV